MEEKKKLISYPEHWEDKLKKIAKSNISDVTKEIKIAIKNHILKHEEL
jgi:hypothetical protein